MIRWRRKSDGFEWHKHVRTTIRLRRADRRRRIDDARQLAVDGVKGVGRAGAAAGSSGLSFAGRSASSAVAALQAGFAALVAALPPAWERLRTTLGATLRAAWESAGKGLRVALRIVSRSSIVVGGVLSRALAAAGSVGGRLMLAACGPIQSRGVQPLLVLVGVIATSAAVVRIAASGMSADAAFTLMVGFLSLLTAALPVLLGVQALPRSGGGGLAMPAWRPGSFAVTRMPSLVPGSQAAGLAAAVVLVAVAVLGGGWLIWRGVTHLATAATSTSLFAQTIAGRAEAVTGDVLRIGDAEIRLGGIEAPESAQSCSIPGNSRWRCGAAARTALARGVRGRRVSCKISGSDDTGRALGTCVADDQDLAQDLVRAGLAFAETGLFSRYGSDEEQARAEKVGLWRGRAERPSEYRARVAEEMARAWEVAKRGAPRGCPIKGRIVSGRKYYVLPGTADYRRVRIRTRRGERWFCSEEEALAAGWKRSPHL